MNNSLIYACLKMCKYQTVHHLLYHFARKEWLDVTIRRETRQGTRSRPPDYDLGQLSFLEPHIQGYHISCWWSQEVSIFWPTQNLPILNILRDQEPGQVSLRIRKSLPDFQASNRDKQHHESEDVK